MKLSEINIGTMVYLKPLNYDEWKLFKVVDINFQRENFLELKDKTGGCYARPEHCKKAILKPIEECYYCGE